MREKYQQRTEENASIGGSERANLHLRLIYAYKCLYYSPTDLTWTPTLASLDCALSSSNAFPGATLSALSCPTDSKLHQVVHESLQTDIVRENGLRRLTHAAVGAGRVRGGRIQLSQ